MQAKIIVQMVYPSNDLRKFLKINSMINVHLPHKFTQLITTNKDECFESILVLNSQKLWISCMSPFFSKSLHCNS